jgi:hypothetical protein
VLEVEFSGMGSIVRGPGARELVVEVSGRAPVWLALHRGYSVQETTARDVVAAAEARNYDVVITGRQALPVPPPSPDVVEVDPGGGLW